MSNKRLGLFCYHFLGSLFQKGNELAQEKPQFAPTVSKKLHGLHEQWDELETTTLKKEQTLFDAHHSELYEQRFTDISTWIKDMEQQVESDDYGKDLTSVNILLSKHKVGPTLCMYSKSCCRAILSFLQLTIYIMCT